MRCCRAADTTVPVRRHSDLNNHTHHHRDIIHLSTHMPQTTTIPQISIVLWKNLESRCSPKIAVVGFVGFSDRWGDTVVIHYYQALAPTFQKYDCNITLPETNSLHLKMDGWKTMNFPFGARPIFRGELLVSGSVIIWLIRSYSENIDMDMICGVEIAGAISSKNKIQDTGPAETADVPWQIVLKTKTCWNCLEFYLL